MGRRTPPKRLRALRGIECPIRSQLPLVCVNTAATLLGTSAVTEWASPLVKTALSSRLLESSNFTTLKERKDGKDFAPTRNQPPPWHFLVTDINSYTYPYRAPLTPHGLNPLHGPPLSPPPSTYTHHRRKTAQLQSGRRYESSSPMFLSAPSLPPLFNIYRIPLGCVCFSLSSHRRPLVEGASVLNFSPSSAKPLAPFCLLLGEDILDGVLC